jgi:hypothetical protein
MKKIIFIIFLAVSGAIAQTGGGFDLQQNVIGNGGWRSSGGGFTILGTMGQSNSGSPASGGGFNLIDGLWAIENPANNSPFANVGGRVTKEGGGGLVRVLMTISDPNTHFVLYTWTQSHGYYSFANIPNGQNYVITPSRRQFEFSPGSISLFISQDRNSVDFVADK